jgi:hypothetical protein
LKKNRLTTIFLKNQPVFYFFLTIFVHIFVTPNKRKILAIFLCKITFNKNTNLTKNMSKTAQSVWENCLSFIKDNIQDQAYKTWFEPIKSVELTDNALYIQVPSKFFYEWLEEHYVKLLKVALTKELGKNAKLLYKIKMENTYGNKQPFTEQLT